MAHKHLDVEQIAREYRGGASARDLAKIHGVSRSTILSRLRDAGVTIRKPGRAPRDGEPGSLRALEKRLERRLDALDKLAVRLRARADDADEEARRVFDALRMLRGEGDDAG